MSYVTTIVASLPSTIFILTDLLCKATNSPMFYIPKLSAKQYLCFASEYLDWMHVEARSFFTSPVTYVVCNNEC